jgi:hypothetical protein
VLKSAKISVGVDGSHGVFNCLVLDESETGVLVELERFVILPEEVTLQMTSGAIYRARRCWSAGGKVGLAFIGGPLITEETAARMRKIGEVMRGHGVPAAVSTLRAARFFDHAELRRIAEEAEAAFLRFEAVLSGRDLI